MERLSPAPWRPEIQAHERKAWKPLVAAGDGDPKDSKFSGTPALLPGETWPLCGNCRKPLQLFLQLNLQTLPKDLQGKFGQGLLQLFYCTSPEPCCEAEGGWEAFNTVSLARRIDLPSGGSVLRPPPGHFPAKRIEGWKEERDLPNWEELGDLGVDVGDEEGEALSEAGFPLPGEKLEGWPYWVQGVEYPDCKTCGERMMLVFQIDSNGHLPHMFGDAGCGHLTQCPVHKDVLAFTWACG